jgi:hypothetical protein
LAPFQFAWLPRSGFLAYISFLKQVRNHSARLMPFLRKPDSSRRGICKFGLTPLCADTSWIACAPATPNGTSWAAVSSSGRWRTWVCARQTYLHVIDAIIDETQWLEQQHGHFFFLMPYARARPYAQQPVQSLFIDGEIALMIAARRVLEEKPEYKAPMTERINLIVERLKSHSPPIAESYPDECWMFDHVVALAAIKLADHLDGTDHSAFLRDWLAMAKQKLAHRESGLLVSSFTLNGDPLDGPEGSTIWMVAHCLQLFDEAFARDQYRRAREQLGRTTCGFGYAREWPASWQSHTDIDSGPIIPVLGISAGSSGMAFIGASAFGDDGFLSSLATTPDFAAFPSRNEGRLRYCASNQVGDAALLYAAVLGPLWEKTKTEPGR